MRVHTLLKDTAKKGPQQSLQRKAEELYSIPQVAAYWDIAKEEIY